MKLVRPASMVTRPRFALANGYKPGFVGRLFNLPIIKADLIPLNFDRPEVEVKSMCWIDFEEIPCDIDVKFFRNVIFDGMLYRGITPKSHKYDNVYECAVDEAELVMQGEYEPPDYPYL